MRAYDLRNTEARQAVQGERGPFGFRLKFIAELWLRKCIGRFEKRGYSENEKATETRESMLRAMQLKRVESN